MNNQCTHISIIGCGHLGSRHLQGLKNINREIIITIVEPDPLARETAKKRFHDMLPEKTLVREVNYKSNIDQLPNQTDVAIIATNADIRRRIVEETLNNTEVGSMILEKVAFQSVDDFEHIIERLKKKNIKAWVNCTRRMYPVYKEIKKILENQKRISFHVDGKNWGMGCNSIHHIDLFAYLTGDGSITLDESGLDKEIYQSKRKGFVEFGGYLTGHSSRGDFLSLVDYKAEDGTRLSFHIVSDEYEFLIHELDKVILESRKEDGWKSQRLALKIPFQSELTYLAVQQILNEGVCELTPLEESFALHKPMIEAFNSILALNRTAYNGVCPIT